jgi:hypothetical protein
LLSIHAQCRLKSSSAKRANFDYKTKEGREDENKTGGRGEMNQKQTAEKAQAVE